MKEFGLIKKHTPHDNNLVSDTKQHWIQSVSDGDIVLADKQGNTITTIYGIRGAWSQITIGFWIVKDTGTSPSIVNCA